MFPSAAEMTADMDEIIADLPSTLVWGAQSVSVVSGDVAKSTDLEMAGAGLNTGVMAVAVVSDFVGSIYPPNNTIVTLNGATVRVISHEKGADNVTVTLMLDRVGA